MADRCYGCGGQLNNFCPNYRFYGYNCLGERKSADGKNYSSPFDMGLNLKRFQIGPDFGENYYRDHPDEFKDAKFDFSQLYPSILS